MALSEAQNPEMQVKISSKAFTKKVQPTHGAEVSVHEAGALGDMVLKRTNLTCLPSRTAQEFLREAGWRKKTENLVGYYTYTAQPGSQVWR